ncbi:astrotactin-2-like isoform X1 [Tachysurus ichikawai]
MARSAARLVLLLLFLLLFLSLEEFLTGTVTGTAAGGAKPGGEKDSAAGACEVKTVTVSTLPVLRESELSVGSGSAGAADSRLLLFVRSDVPGAVSVLDDLDNTALPYFTLVLAEQREEAGMAAHKSLAFSH